MYILNIVSITDLKQNTASLISKLPVSGVTVVMRRSRPAAVLVNPDYYRMLEEALEELEDLKAIEDRRNEPGIPWDLLRATLRKGLKN